jgi:translation elongation factor EF-G
MPVTLIGEMKYAKQTAGRGQYGHVRLRVVLDDGVQGVVFGNEVDRAIPAEFIPAIESGVMTAVRGGILQQYGYSDARITLIDGSFHDLDSSSTAFFLAGSMALDNALRKLPRRPSDDGGDEGPGVRAPAGAGRPGPRDAAAVPEPDDPYA